MSDNWSGARALITGPRGFVGSHLCEALLRRGVEVVGLELAGPGAGYFDSEDLEARVSIVQGSITDPEALESVFADHEFHYVFHLAAQAIVGKATQDPVGAFEVNVRGTYLVLETCRRVWDEGRGPLRGVVTAGSDRVYDRQQTPPYTEEMPLLALSPYDASKISADVITRAYAATYELPATVARCANIYGPGDANLSRIVPDTIVNILRGERPQIRSDGTPERDYLFVGDAAEGYIALAQRCAEEGVGGEAFNLGTGTPVSVLELVREICAACGQPELEPEVLGQPTGDIDRQYVSAQRAAQHLGWTARTPRSEGLAQTVEWYREHLAQLSP